MPSIPALSTKVGASIPRRGKQACGELLIICDADILISAPALRQGVEICAQQAVAANLFNQLASLDNQETEDLLSGKSVPDFDHPAASAARREREQLFFCGGAFVIRRDFLLSIGGFDERFLGWGGEDDAMTAKLQRWCKVMAEFEDSTALHLWHPSNREETFGQPHYQQNVALLQELAQLDKAEFDFQ